MTNYPSHNSKALITNMRTILLSLIGSTLLLSTASALTLLEKKQLSSWNSEIKEHRYVSATSKNCGSPIEAQLDKSVVTEFMEKNRSASAYCVEVYSALSGMCEADDISKNAISGGVKRVVCTSAESGKAGFKLSKDGVLTFEMNVGFPNIEKESIKFLNNNL